MYYMIYNIYDVICNIDHTCSLEPAEAQRRKPRRRGSEPAGIQRRRSKRGSSDLERHKSAFLNPFRHTSL